ncbi:MAG TPA: ferritin-like domain-containing protein [Planctomycetota bacterium]|nr:ferritin-like domain-containing protein [Planctomycetota bacterium]
MRQHEKHSMGGAAVAEMPNEHLHEPFVEGLKDMYDAEKRLVKAIPKLVKAASCESLKQGLSKHLKETAGHVNRLEKVFQSIGETAKTKTCPAMKGLVEEGADATNEDDERSRDAAIIAAAQKVEHYEIASYGTLRTWAEAMGHNEAADLLEETLNEEKAADKKLTEIAKTECNKAESGEFEVSEESEESEDSDEEETEEEQ